ncbi:MAG TPA: right-handed parallel beta-helix repeat-containing protein, partial [Lacunisphaera sp.]
MKARFTAGRGLLAAALFSSAVLGTQAKVLTLTKDIIDFNSSRIDFGVPTIPTRPPVPTDPPIPWTHNLAAGDTIEIEGHAREQLVLLRINPPGAASNRVTITNKSNGQFVINTGDTAFKKGFTFSGCSNFVLKGTEVSDQPGIVIAQTPADISGITITQYSSGASVIGATNFEVRDLEISNTGFAGLFIKCDGVTGSSGVSMDNVLIHGLNIHDTGGEGMYIGASDFAVADRQEIHGIEIRDNTITNTGWDGIQLGCATQNASIHHNIINGYGVLAAGEDWQDEGIRSNPGTRADIYSNVIIGSPTNSGTGIFADPYNSVKIYNNVIVTPQERGIYILDSEYPKAYTVGYQVTLANNTIIQPGTYGIEFANPAHSAANRLINNLIIVSPVTRAESILESLVGLRSGNLYRTTVEEIGFVAPATRNYELTAGSPAIDIGYNAAGDGITTDIDGIVRPQGGAYDAGAYEYVASVSTPPAITTQPTSRTVSVGASTTFTVAATGTAPLSYQWRRNGTAISGATSASYTISSVQTSHAGGYSVVATNSAGSATS